MMHMDRTQRRHALSLGRRARTGLAQSIDALDDLTDVAGLEPAERRAVVDALGKVMTALQALNDGAPVLTALQTLPREVTG